MDNYDNLIVLGIVFIAVLVCAVVFLPVFFTRNGKSAQETGFDAVDDPARRFIQPDVLRKMRYSACMIVGVSVATLMIFLNCYWGLLLAPVAALIAYQIPQWVLDRKIKKRNERFEEGMLDFTILIANTLRAGIALPSAIEMAIGSVGGPIREEFSVVLREHRLGVDLAESIERLTKRIQSENLQLFSATICVTMKTGGSMADVLDHVIVTIRQRSAFYDKLKTMISQSEFEAVAISLAPAAAFVILYLIDKPLMLPMLVSPIGWAVIGLVIFWEAIGFLVLRKVVQVKF